ncbi:MAG: undecaprenyl-diphosphate phosphatase, partial [Actinobacteria bacterium]
MTVLQAMVVGIVQGVTEFLPVSSDGHLALTYRAFGMDAADPMLFTYTVFLHGATLVAMLVYFRSDLLALAKSLAKAGKGSPDRRLLLLIGAATLVSGGIAYFMGDVVEAANESLLFIGIGFLVTTAALAAAEYLASRARRAERDEVAPDALTWPRLAGIAVAQAAAVLPGVSRSGSTIAGGMAAEPGARFSFLL